MLLTVLFRYTLFVSDAHYLYHCGFRTTPSNQLTFSGRFSLLSTGRRHTSYLLSRRTSGSSRSFCSWGTRFGGCFRACSHSETPSPGQMKTIPVCVNMCVAYWVTHPKMQDEECKTRCCALLQATLLPLRWHNRESTLLLPLQKWIRTYSQSRICRLWITTS
jgi:hypothetical protein